MTSQELPSVSPEADSWQQGQLVELTITDLSDDGAGVGRVEGRVVFVPDTAPGDRVEVRLVRVKRQYAEAKLHQILEPSPQRQRPPCIVADKCGGCQWQHIAYSHQLEAKRNQVIQALERIGGFENPPVAPILAPATDLHYRNKVTYPLDRSATGQVQAGYYRKGSHRLINLNQCPVQDERFDPLLREIKEDLQTQGWSIYDEEKHRGKLRHLSFRVGRRTGEILLTLVSREESIPGLAEQATQWLERYPQLVGVCLNVNSQRTNAIFGPKTDCIAGQGFLTETFAELQYQIGPTTFFQVYTEQAEAMLEQIVSTLQLTGQEMLVDAYCGVGTLTLPLAQRVRQVVGLEVHEASVEQARANAALNWLTNATFLVGSVETLLPSLEQTPDVVLLDPPRKGCDRRVIEALIAIAPARIVYMSCKPATLARDLKLLAEQGYRLTRVQPADFFPQTSHVECVAFLERGDRP